MRTILLLTVISTFSTVQAADALVKLVLGTASAKPNTVLSRGTTFSTGKKSRSEVALQGGLFRTGSDTAVTITDDRTLGLQKGLTLVASKPKLIRSSVSVNTPTHAIKVRGTAQIYYDPGRSIRVVALEGQVTVALHSLRGESVTLRRGQELIIHPSEKLLPTPVEVDLNRLMSTMALLDQSTFPRLNSEAQLQACAELQEQELVEGDELESTSIVMSGAAPEIELLSEEIVHDEADDEIDDLDGDGEDDAEIALDEDGFPIDSESDVADDAANTDDGGATDDAGGDDSADRKGQSTGSYHLSGRKISADQITIGSPNTTTRIYIRNSSEVAAIAGALRMLSKGGVISVDASTLKSTSQIILDASGTHTGVVGLRDATLNASVIKARAFAPAGDALIIDGSTLNADQLIQLYAEGTSTLRFRNQVTLNTNQAIIAGKTVEVDSGGNVNVRGKADIYTDAANFNRSGYGNINAGGGVTTRPHHARPGF